MISTFSSSEVQEDEVKQRQVVEVQALMINCDIRKAECIDDDDVTIAITDDTDVVEQQHASIVATASSTDDDLFERLPDEIIDQLFQRLELKERCAASEVCRRWHRILTDGTSPLDDVVVINLFESSVWRNHVHSNAGTRIRCIPLANVDALRSILAHVCVSNSVKLWFTNAQFANAVLEVIQECGVRFKCLDVYPYGRTVPLNIIRKHLPKLSAMTMRPHGSEFFWTGLQLDEFPLFDNLDTLLLDSINLHDNSILPTTLTTLEWCNRGERRFDDVRPKLKYLVNLEYLLLGHVDFEPDGQFIAFLDVVNTKNLSKLQYLVFRFCKFARIDFTHNQHPPVLDALKVLKLDLCYGQLANTIDCFLTVTNTHLKIVSINQIVEDLPLADIYHVLAPLHQRKLSLHLGLLQKSPQRKELLPNSVSPHLIAPPNLLRTVLWKFEASFVDDQPLLETLLSAGIYSYTNELKFVQCSGLTNELLGVISKCCPRLKKLSLINCDSVKDAGMMHFVRDFADRTSDSLQVIWKRSRDHPATFYLQLVNDYRHLLKDLNARFIAKKFPNDIDGERIVIWNKRQRSKLLIIQDYGDSDRHRILGFSIPPFDDDQLTTVDSTASIPLVAINSESQLDNKQ